MTLYFTHPLSDPIPTGDGGEVTEVKFLKPRSRHVVNLVLAIGADTVANLIDRWQEKSETSDESASFSKEEIRSLLTDLLTDQRANACFEAIAHYLEIPVHQAENLSLEDLFAIGMKIADFFPGTAQQIAATSGAMRSK